MRKKKSKAIKCHKAKKRNARVANFKDKDTSDIEFVLKFEIMDYLSKM